MKELIIKITAKNPDIEILYNDLFNSEIIEKNISLDAFSKVLQAITNRNKDTALKCEYLDPSIIGFAEEGSAKQYIIHQPAHQRWITYSNSGDNKAYQINFPNSIYIVAVHKDKISEIRAFMYLEWEDLCTKLYRYAMPNMLSGDKICIGSAKKDIEKNIVETLEAIIYAPYSHETLSNIKTFRKTTDYFEYLTVHEIQKRHLYDTERVLKDLF